MADKQIISTNIKVLIRVRPLLQNENKKWDLIQIENNCIKIVDSVQTYKQKFDQVFDINSNQSDIFSSIKDSIDNCFKGYNLTIMTYGQTNSGKTHTMFGSDWESIAQNTKISKIQQNTFYEDIQSDLNYAGIIPRAIHQIFQMKEKQLIKFKIIVNFIQIYNEKIFDLLQLNNNIKQNLEIHESKVEKAYIQNLLEIEVQNYEQCLQLLKRGERQRIVRETCYNTKSSRSHTIFQIIIQSEEPDHNGNFIKSKLNLCDLAGSEKVNKNEMISQEHMNELKNINKSLTTLGKCINCLTIKNQKLPPPFRESKLTRLLQDSLGGNTQTYIITNISENLEYIEDTKNTLKFAENAQHIVSKVQQNQISAQDQDTVNRLQSEIMYLKNVLSMRNKQVVVKNDFLGQVQQLQNENRLLKAQNVSPLEFQILVKENQRYKAMLKEIQEKGNNVQEMDQDTQNNDKKESSQSNTTRQTTQQSHRFYVQYNSKSKFQQKPINQEDKQKQSHRKYNSYQDMQKKRVLERINEIDNLQNKNQEKLEQQLKQITNKQIIDESQTKQKYMIKRYSQNNLHNNNSSSNQSTHNGTRQAFKIKKMENMYLN